MEVLTRPVGCCALDSVFLNLLALIVDTSQKSLGLQGGPGETESSKSLNSGIVFSEVVIPVCFTNYPSCSLLVSPQ